MISDIQQQKNVFYTMLRIRRIEEAIAAHYPEQKMRTPVHLSIGQEAVAALVGTKLRADDFAVSTHRAHAHYLAKGGSLNAMIAEIYGKVTGCCRGRGGSMHLIDQSVGFMGSTAIVGNTIPIGVGLGLAIQLAGTDAISCVFVGDGAIEEGVFFESLNFAVLKNLPVLFICENNRYSVYSPFAKRQPAGRRIHDMAKAVGAHVDHADGYDVFASEKIIQNAIHHLRAKQGPCFLEFETYRWLEHCGPNYDNDIGYRTEAECKAWQERDPIKHFKQHLIDAGLLSEADNAVMEQTIQQEIQDAFAFAEASPYPDALEATNGQYKQAAESVSVKRAGEMRT